MTANRVLVVDDDPIMLRVIKERLTGAGYEVFLREHALGTSQWIAAHKPDVILLDVLMPALSGSDLALLLKKNAMTAKIGIILHSGLSAEELSGLVRLTGAVGSIRKTADAKLFLREFDNLMQHFIAVRDGAA